MIVDELARRIRQALGFTPTAEQAVAIDTFCRFMTDRDEHSALIMRGSAGTGKTTLAAAIVKTMKALGQKVTLLAPTGRAAKVFSLNAGHAALTIHRRIYRQKTFTGDMTGFNLNVNLTPDMLFMVDEASMIADNAPSDMATFGTGRLLDDLISYVYNGRNCRLMLIGDKAQLPPVGEEESPALTAAVIEGYGLKVYECDLNEVLRQAAGSGILYNATVIRQMITHDEATLLPRISFSGFADICMVPGGELIEQLSSSFSEVGIDETIVITRSNKRANIYNAGIRGTVLDREEQLTTGDMLMVVKNNYYWLEKEKLSEKRTVKSEKSNSILSEKVRVKSEESNSFLSEKVKVKSEKSKCDAASSPTKQMDSSLFTLNSSLKTTFLANGDRACVRRVRNVRELYGFHFADVLLSFPDYDYYELQATVLTDTLTADAPALTRQQSEQLFNAVLEDYQDIPLKTDRMKQIRQDMYYNALQVKYAYAVTCHKAQGGQWAHVYVDQGYMTDDMLTPDYIHWLYTAFTRATEKLFLINWPKTQTLT